MDHTHVVNQVIEKYGEYTKPPYMEFVDYETTFHSVLTTALPEALKDKRIEQAYIRLLEDMYK